MWISHGYTCVPHAEPPSHYPPYPIPQGHPSARALSALFHTPNLDWWSISLMVISWSWNSNSLDTWCEELTHLKRPWCWERLRAREGDDSGQDSWMASLTRWTWVWASSGRWWWTGKPGVLQSMGSQRVKHDWGTELKKRDHHFRITSEGKLGTLQGGCAILLGPWVSVDSRENSWLREQWDQSSTKLF